MRLHRRAYGVLLAVADHQHDPHDARDLGCGAHRARDDRDAGQRQQDLVDLCPHPGAGAGREDDDGGPHRWTRAVAIAAIALTPTGQAEAVGGGRAERRPGRRPPRTARPSPRRGAARDGGGCR